MKSWFAWLRGREPVSPGQPPPGPIADLQVELTDLAVRIARDSFRTRLDFSHRSIERVEAILADIHREYVKSGDREGLDGIALEFGAYIATTIQRRTGEGVLERDHPEFGEASFPFHFSRGTIFPYAWCAKRIFDGPGEDVSAKYQALVLGAAHG